VPTFAAEGNPNMKEIKRGAAAAIFAFAPVLLASCGSSDTATGGASTTSPPAIRAPVRAPSSGGGGSRQEAFLARIKAAARANGVIQQARMNGDSELGVVLGQNVKLRQVKPLMTSLLREMRDTFPRRALTVIAYAPNGRTLATMRYNPNAPASANVTFTPAPGLK
jgi:hypothetical protein